MAANELKPEWGQPTLLTRMGMFCKDFSATESFENASLQRAEESLMRETGRILSGSRPDNATSMPLFILS